MMTKQQATGENNSFITEDDSRGVKFSFCSHRNESVNTPMINNECFIDGLNCLPHILVILAVIPVLIVLNKTQLGGCRNYSWIHFPCHKSRWIVTLVLLLLILAEITEGILSSTHHRAFYLHLFVPDILALTAVVFAISYYHNIEQWNSPRFLLLLVGYWIGALTNKSLQISHLVSKDVPIKSMRYMLTSAVFSCYLTLFIIEGLVWWNLVSIDATFIIFI